MSHTYAAQSFTVAASNFKWLCRRMIDKKSQIHKKVKRGFGRADRLLAGSYIAASQPRKLHLGCGKNVQKGWLNTDFEPQSLSIMQLDATDKFPFPNDTFDFVFSEHMIEHVPYRAGMKMLAECYRVLKPDGTLRISTPDLRFLIDMARPVKTELQRAYLQYSADESASGRPDEVGEVFLINRFVREWGHTFIYDEPTLVNAIAKAGFTEITKCKLSESRYPALRNIENVGRMPPGMLELETVIIEGTKAPVMPYGGAGDVWKPMETAPKNGSSIFLLCEDRVVQAKWGPGRGLFGSADWARDGGGRIYEIPNAWREGGGL